MLQDDGHQHPAAVEIPAVGERYLASDVLVDASIIGRWARRCRRDDAQHGGDRDELKEGTPHGAVRSMDGRQNRDMSAQCSGDRRPFATLVVDLGTGSMRGVLEAADGESAISSP